MRFIDAIIEKLGLVRTQDLIPMLGMVQQDNCTLAEFVEELELCQEEMDSERLKFFRTRDVKVPERGTDLSAGYDFFLPNDFGHDLVIEPGQSALIPTGIHVSFPEHYVFIGFNKSGVAAKYKLLIGSQVIDADYQGQMHINLHNVGTETQTFKPGAKLTQFILLYVGLLPLDECSSIEELYGNVETERGAGGFGSTGV